MRQSQYFKHNASVYLHRKGEYMVYFIATVIIDENRDNREYESYIREVKPIVEGYGGRYLIRTDCVIPLSEKWKPDRVIIIEWENKEQLEACFSSEEYRKIAAKRENSVDAKAIIVGE